MEDGGIAVWADFKKERVYLPVCLLVPPAPTPNPLPLTRLTHACRSEEERLRDGVPSLQYGAIGKGAAVPLPFIGGALARNVRNANELAFQIAAAVVSGLGQVPCECSSIVFIPCLFPSFSWGISGDCGRGT
jgi:hypothetical protein